MFELRMLGYRFLKAFMKPVVKLVPQPRPVVFLGPDSALRLCRMIGEFGFRRVLIVTDATLVERKKWFYEHLPRGGSPRRFRPIKDSPPLPPDVENYHPLNGPLPAA